MDKAEVLKGKKCHW